MSEETKPEVLPRDLITRPGVYESRSHGVVEVRHWDEHGWVAQWQDVPRHYAADGTRPGINHFMPDPWQLLEWVGPLPPQKPQQPTTSEQIAEIEEQAADYTPPEGWRVLQPGEALQPGDAWAHPQADLFEENLNLVGVAGRHGYYLRRIEQREQTITTDDVGGLVGQQLIRGLVLQVAEAIANEEATEQPQPQPEPQPEPQQAPMLQDADQRISLLKHANNTQAETIGRLQSEIRDLRVDLAEANQKRNAYAAQIGHLETINGWHAETISGLNSEIHALNMEIGGLNRERSQKDDRIGYLETMNAGQAAAVRAAGEQNTQLRTLADNARRQLEAAADEISELRQALDNAEKQLDQKDAQLRDLRIELEAAQQVTRPLNDEQREQIWDQATEQAGEQLIRWLRPLTQAMIQQPDDRLCRFMAMTLSIFPDVLPHVLGYAEEQGKNAEG